MQDFKAEAESRKMRRLGEIGDLAHERYQLCKNIEDTQQRIEVLDRIIGQREAAIHEIDQSIRDFDTWKAVAAATDSIDETGASVGGQPPE